MAVFNGISSYFKNDRDTNKGQGFYADKDAHDYAGIMSNILNQSSNDIEGSNYKKSKLLYDAALGLAENDLAGENPEDLELKENIEKHLANLQAEDPDSQPMSADEIRSNIGIATSPLAQVGD